MKSNREKGIKKTGEGEFVYEISKESLNYIINAIEPFTKKDIGGHQWLDDNSEDGEIDFLFSPGGTW